MTKNRLDNPMTMGEENEQILAAALAIIGGGTSADQMDKK